MKLSCFNSAFHGISFSIFPSLYLFSFILERWICYEMKVYLLRWITRFFLYNFPFLCFYCEIYEFFIIFYMKGKRRENLSFYRLVFCWKTVENKVGGFYGVANGVSRWLPHFTMPFYWGNLNVKRQTLLNFLLWKFFECECRFYWIFKTPSRGWELTSLGERRSLRLNSLSPLYCHSW